ncbi:MAG: sulfite reductase flavoprotein subunit alpha, partial [Alphaproteobacteria bacterium]
ANAPLPAARQPLTILYGTESGNAEAVADAAKRIAGRAGFAARLVDMADADLGSLKDAGALMVVVSTWGEGEPPQRAAAFYAALLAEDAPRLDGLCFSVLALGDRAYAQFCEVGRRIDERLAELGAERAAGRVDCDLDFEAPAEAWTREALQALRKPDADGPGAAVIHVDFALAPPALQDWTRSRPFEAEITEAVNLNGSGSSKQTVHLELSLAGSGIRYEPGDALAVVPENDPGTVEAVMNAAGLGGDDALRAALLVGHDVTTLTRPMVEGYAALTGDPAVAALAEEGRFRAYAEGRQVLDLVADHPHRLTPEQLKGLLRPLPARSYSLASSLDLVPDEAHLLVAPVRYETHGRGRLGVASTFLADRRRAGERVRVFLKPNRHFRLPADPGVPVVMIGPGTGIAPFRAFLQQREAAGVTGRSWLFFGERNFTHDFLYQLDWQAWLKEGVLTRMDVAFSRDQAAKVYVQHRMWERRAELWAWLQDGARLYVCGDEKQMARDVHAMLRRIAADRGGLGAEAVDAYVAGLIRDGRYLRDVY